MPQFGATFMPGHDDYMMPEVVAPSPQRYVLSSSAPRVALSVRQLYPPKGGDASSCGSPWRPRSRQAPPELGLLHTELEHTEFELPVADCRWRDLPA
jgi:hypothetical protein